MLRRSLTALSTVVAAVVLLSGCGTGGGALSPDERAEYEPRAAAMGVDLDYVYVTEAEGYERATGGGTGVYGADAFQVQYTGGSGHFSLTVDGSALDAAACPTLPVVGAPVSATVVCEQDGDGWYRTVPGGDLREYAMRHGEQTVRATARGGAVDRATLKQAAENARPATAGELDEMLPSCPKPCKGTDRGDLPKNGDGAPVDPPKLGGVRG